MDKIFGKQVMIGLICFVMLMVTPACAVQVGSSIYTNTAMIKNENKGIPTSLTLKNLLNKQNIKQNRVSIKQSSKTHTHASNTQIDSDTVKHARELLPVIQSDYKNGTDQITNLTETLYDLEKQKKDIIALKWQSFTKKWITVNLQLTTTPNTKI